MLNLKECFGKGELGVSDQRDKGRKLSEPWRVLECGKIVAGVQVRDCRKSC